MYAKSFPLVFFIATIMVQGGSLIRAQEAPSFWPTDADRWVNTRPIQYEELHGKAVMFYFFEETCPRCRKLWPEFINAIEEYDDQPMMVIAVNSGTSKSKVESYARSVKVNLPMIVDSDRSFEKAANISEISLQNIRQIAFIDGSGKLSRGFWSDIPKTAGRALRGASWKLDLGEMPESLNESRRAIEFGLYSQTAKDIERAKKSDDESVKAAANRLFQFVTEQLQTEFDTAWELGKEKKYYEAFVAMDQLQTKYQGFPLPEKLTQGYNWLKKMDSVNNEVRAQRSLKLAQAALASSDDKNKSRNRSRAETLLKTLIKRYPDTMAAQTAKELLGEID